MDIRMLDQNDIPAAKALWEKAFGDSDAFIETYFKNKITPGNSLGMFDGGLISVVHMLPFKVRLQGAAVQSAYIAGASTDEKHRGRGHMKTMLHESLVLMRNHGIWMTHLYPFKHSFYEKFGWATYSFVDKRTVSGSGRAADVVETTDANMLAGLYDTMMTGFDGYVIRGDAEWYWRLEELFSDGGRVFVLMKGGAPAAYMMAYDDGDTKEAIETVYTDEADAHTLAQHLLTLGSSAVKYRLATQQASAAPHGMARVVDANKLLCAFGLEGLTHTMRITDSFAEWNNIGCGHTQFGMDISVLAALAHRGESAHKDGESQADRPGEKQSIIFAPRNTCIFEEY